MILLILYFLILLYLTFYKAQPNTVSRIMLFLYTFSCAISIIGFYSGMDCFHPTFGGIFYYICCQLILLLPFYKFPNLTCNDFDVLENYSTIRKISISLSICGILCIFYMIPNIMFAYSFGGDLSALRLSYYQDNGFVGSGQSILNVLVNVVSYLSFLLPSLCILHLINNDYKYAALSFIASLELPLSGYCIGEREASVKWIIFFVFSILFFRPILSEKLFSIIKKVGVMLSAPIVGYIVLMTVSRFGERDGGLLQGLFDYIGKQPYNFCIFYENINQHLWGKVNFGPLFPGNERMTGTLNDNITSEYALNCFAGLPGSFWLDFGIYTILILFLYPVVYQWLFSTKRKMSIRFKLQYYFFYWLFLYFYFMGIFYNDVTMKYIFWWIGIIPVLSYLYYQKQKS